jgi:exonuclease VII small subunit
MPAKAKTKEVEAGESVDLKKSLTELKAIVEWFDEQDEVDIEAGLEKVRKGSILVKQCKSRLAEIENEFLEIERAATEE